MRYLFAILSFPAVILALKVASPAKDSEWETGKAQTVTFESVSTDPTSIDVMLVNQHVYPTVSIVLGTMVDASKGAFAIPSEKLAGVVGGDGYQINLVSTSNDGILAQSGTFTIEVSSDVSPVISSASHTQLASAATMTATSAQNAASAPAVAATTSASANVADASPSGSSAGSAASTTAHNAGTRVGAVRSIPEFASYFLATACAMLWLS